MKYTKYNNSRILIYQYFQIPGVFFTVQRTSHDWQFTAESDTACRGYKDGCFWPRGKMLGGSHGMNAMLYIRGHHKDYDNWEKLGNPTWGWNDVLPYFKKSEANQNPDLVKYKNGKYHSNKGPLKVDHYYNNEHMSQVILDAAKEVGYDFIDDLNADNLLGYAFSQGTIFNGTRQTVAKSFLIPAKDRPNLHIIKNALVTRINIDDDGTAKSVEFTYNNTKKFTVETKKEIVLSAGSVMSPQILMLSGIGPEKHLSELKIPVKQNLPVGHNLRDHIYVPLFFEFHRSNPARTLESDFTNMVYNYFIHKSGALANTGTADLCGFINTGNHTGYPDIETHHLAVNKSSTDLPIYLNTLGFREDISNYLLKINQNVEILTIYVILLNPKSKGKIELSSSVPTDKPKIYPNYFNNADDLETLVRGFRHQVGLQDTSVFKKHEGSFIRLPLAECDEKKYMSDEYVKCYIKYLASTLYHPTSTSRMGPDSDKEAVVDSHLRVKGIKNLRQIDAGIMPTIVSANTNAATIMIAEKGADFIKEEWNVAQKHLQDEL